jgi:hypothetical protein
MHRGTGAVARSGGKAYHRRAVTDDTATREAWFLRADERGNPTPTSIGTRRRAKRGPRTTG